MSEKVIDFSEVLNRVERKFVLLKDDSTQYANAVALMNAYMISLRDLYKPEKADFNHEPELYDSISKNYEDIQATATEYATYIYGQLLSNPQKALRSLSSIDRKLLVSIDTIQKIIDDPDISEDNLNNKINDLTDYFNEIIQIADEQIELLGYLLDNLKKFKETSIKDVTEDLTQILNGITITDDKFKDAVEALEKLKKDVEKEEKEAIAGVVISGISLVAALVVGGLGIVAAVASGGTTLSITIAIIAGIMGSVGSVGGVGYSVYELVEAEKKLKEITAELDDYEEDILLITNWKDEVLKCQDGIDDLIENVSVIQGAWQDVNAGFVRIKTLISEDEKHLTEQNWIELKAALQKVQTVSVKLQTKISGMKIENQKFTKAKIEIGMDEQAVAKAIEEAGCISFREYMLAM